MSGLAVRRQLFPPDTGHQGGRPSTSWDPGPGPASAGGGSNAAASPPPPPAGPPRGRSPGVSASAAFGSATNSSPAPPGSISSAGREAAAEAAGSVEKSCWAMGMRPSGPMSARSTWRTRPAGFQAGGDGDGRGERERRKQPWLSGAHPALAVAEALEERLTPRAREPEAAAEDEPAKGGAAGVRGLVRPGGKGLGPRARLERAKAHPETGV